MRIAFFDARDYDHLYFDRLTAQPPYRECEIVYLESHLDPRTAPLAAGCQAACAFVNSDCSRPVLEYLHTLEIRLLLLRCTGCNNVDLPAAKELDITVLRVPGYSPQAVAEHAMALALCACRRIHKAYVRVRNNNFALDGLLGWNLYGRTAGIVGTGQIGTAMARICRGFGMKVLAFDRFPNPALESEHLLTYVPFETLLEQSDLVSLHCPLTNESYHLLNDEALARMKAEAILVNTSRGGLIDTPALFRALRRKKFAGVGLDVYEHEDGMVYEDLSDDIVLNDTVPLLLSFPNVVITSHQGFFTRTALAAIAQTTIENAFAFFEGEELKNRIS